MGFAKSVRYGIEEAAARALTSGLARVDVDKASAMGAGLSKLVRKLLPGREALARENLRHAFPDMDPAPVLDEMWTNLGRTFFELVKMRDLEERGGGGVLEFLGAEHVAAAQAQGRGIVFISGHIANWEVAALAMSLQGLNPAILVRQPNNPGVNELLLTLRPKGCSFLDKSRQGMGDAFRVLRDGGNVAFLMDHRYRKGVPVDFFGRQVPIPSTAALMARKYGSPIVPLRPERVGDGARFRVTAYPPLEVDYGMDPDTFAHDVTQQAMRILEGWIRERPGHWFWVQSLWAARRPKRRKGQ